MGIVIDISEAIHGKKPEPVDTTGAEAPPPMNAVPDRTVTMEREAFDACQHRSMQIDDKQRTVKCGTCGIWLDPVWCLRELFRYYEQRVDSRLEEIREADKRERDRRERQEQRKRKPRAHRLRVRDENLERAAYNEYQARRMALLAERQRERAANIDAELGTDATAEVEAAVARERMRATSKT